MERGYSGVCAKYNGFEVIFRSLLIDVLVYIIAMLMLLLHPRRVGGGDANDHVTSHPGQARQCSGHGILDGGSGCRQQGVSKP